MPLQNTSIDTGINWSQTNVVSSGQNATTQSGSQGFALNNLNLTTFNKAYVAHTTIALSSSTTIDCTSLTDLVGEAINFSLVKAIQIMPVGANITVGPGASNGLVWMLDDATAKVTVKNGGVFLWSESGIDTGTTVDGTHKNITITNLSGAVSVAVTIYLLGSSS